MARLGSAESNARDADRSPRHKNGGATAICYGPNAKHTHAQDFNACTSTLSSYTWKGQGHQEGDEDLAGPGRSLPSTKNKGKPARRAHQHAAPKFAKNIPKGGLSTGQAVP